MKKKIIIAIIGLVVLIGAIAGIKGLQIMKMMGQKRPVHAETVTAAVVQPQNLGINAYIRRVAGCGAGRNGIGGNGGEGGPIAFEPGSRVQAGDLLVQQDVAAETAQLRSAEATLALAKNQF